MLRISMIDSVAAMIMVPVVFIISSGHPRSSYVNSMEVHNILFQSDVEMCDDWNCN